MLVPYTNDEMFALVDNIQQYHQFLPWCQKSQELARSEEEVRAELQIGMDRLTKSFTTANKRFPSERIELNLVNGPFRHLQGTWAFRTEGEKACHISLDLEFEFANKLLGLAFGKIFNVAVENMITAFSARAKEIYGERVMHVD